MRSITKKNKQRALLLSVLVIGLMLGGVFLVQIPLSTYGYPDLWEETNNVQMSAGDILNVQDGDTLVAWLIDDTSDQHKPTDLDWTVTLRLTSDDSWIEDGGDASKIGEVYPSVVGNNMRWWFNLESCLEGSFSYRVYWFAMIGDSEVDAGGYSFAFTVENTEAPVYNDAEFVTEPDTAISYAEGQLGTYATWKVNYDGAFTASVTVDGTEDWTETFDVSSGDDMVMYPVDTSVVGTQSIVLTITPDNADNLPLVSDTVIVTIEEATTDTGTTTPDTGTTTPDPEPDEPTTDWMVYSMIAGVLFIVGYVLHKKTERGRR